MNIHPKVAMGGIGGSIAVIVVWLVSLAGIYPPTEVCAAFAALCSALAGYLTSNPDVNSVDSQSSKDAVARLQDQLKNASKEK